MDEGRVISHADSGDDGYPELERLVAARVAGHAGPLFRTNRGPGLFWAFLDELPKPRRQHYNCSACRKFIERYGVAVTVSESGEARTLLWEPGGVPAFFAEAVARLRGGVLGGRVCGVLLSKEETWGTPVTGEWTHLSGTPPPAIVFRDPLKSAFQKEAEFVESYGILQRGLAEFPAAAVEQAVRVLEADALDRSEKTLGIAKWLLALHRSLDGAKGLRRDNLVWRAVALAPPGWCNVRSTMVGTLLEDVVSGLDFDAISRRWAAKMHPLRYQRPVTLKAGNVERAERVIAELGSAGALARRFARLSEVEAHATWRPKGAPPGPEPGLGEGAGVFGHLLAGRKSEVREVELPAKVMTYEKFRSTVLPEALEIDFRVPSGRSSFFALATAVNPDAPPLLQWDGLEGFPRNPFSWYFYAYGSSATDWGLEAGSWCPVRAILPRPPQWQKPELFARQGEAAFFVLEGAKDLRHTAGIGLFPESLRSEYREVRATLEAYSNRATLAGKEDGDANGIALQKGSAFDFVVRVKTAGGTSTYRLDRWE